MVGGLTLVLVVIWMVMAPSPVVVLLSASRKAKLAIVSVMFAQVDSIGTVFPVIPFMIIMVIAIVVAGVTALSDNHFLGCGCLGGCRGSERGRQKYKTQISRCSVQGVLRKSRTPKAESRLTRSMRGDSVRVCAIEDITTCAPSPAK